MSGSLFLEFCDLLIDNVVSHVLGAFCAICGTDLDSSTFTILFQDRTGGLQGRPAGETSKWEDIRDMLALHAATVKMVAVPEVG